MASARRPWGGRILASRTGLARALAVALLLCAVLLPALFGGMPYAWCVPMAKAQLHCCCHAYVAALRRHDAPDHRAAAELSAPCCEGRRVTSLPLSDLSFHCDTAIAPAALMGLIAVVLLVLLRVPMNSAWIRGRGHPTRAGPQARLFKLHCAYLC